MSHKPTSQDPAGAQATTDGDLEPDNLPLPGAPLDCGSPAPATRPPRWYSRWLLMLVVSALWCAADQASKHWAHTALLDEHGGRIELLEGYLALSYVRNPGAAWGFLAQTSPSFRRPFFLIVSVVAMAFIFYLFVRLHSSQRLLMVALASVMGGAAGNLIDRLRFNYVIDFIDFYVRQSFRWPTFNVADAAITGGVAILFCEMIVAAVHERRARRLAAAEAPRSTDPPPAVDDHPTSDATAGDPGAPADSDSGVQVDAQK